ncbi:putative signal-transduction protein containing cAMP-binding and CBS domains [Thiovulum sp. ES]|nr:putative signal-transduction protein containing cAMP-binding and CBS domains [Thiovulum sp. ES]
MSSEVLQFFSQINPFNYLEKDILQTVVENVDIGYYKIGEELISPKNSPEILYVILKGEVSEIDPNNEKIALYHEGESFDGRSLFYEKCENIFRVEEELIAYEIPKKIFKETLESSALFQRYYFDSLSKKIDLLKSRKNVFSSFIISRVSDIFLHSATVVSENETVYNAVTKREKDSTSTVFVTGGELKIFTDSNLRKAILEKEDLNSEIGKLNLSNAVAIQKNDFLFNALILFLKHKIKRLAVLDGKDLIGVLEQIDLLSHFSNHSSLMMVQIEKANSIEELKNATEGFISLIKSLYEKGVKVRRSAKLISEINIRIYDKLYKLIFPENLQKRMTLFIMGSEGRQEQIFRTDQDNGLILENSLNPDEVSEFAKKFTETMIELGYPPCDGNMMVSNPYWVNSFDDWKRRIDKLFDTRNPESLLEIATLIDLKPIAGDLESGEKIYKYLLQKRDDNRFLIKEMSDSIFTFETPISLFKNFLTKKRNELDIKKGGIFAIVHGIRVLAFENGIYERNTTERIKELNNIGVLNREFAEELIEALDTLLEIRLFGRLEKYEKGEELDNFVNPEKLKPFQKELLKDSFRIVNRFKKFLSYHFTR